MSHSVRGGVTRLIKGVEHFQERVFSTKETLFRRLEGGQSPTVLFITCSDSRVNPNLLTQTEPGELFILRNAGNIVPPYSAGPSGEAATVEFGIRQLKVRDIVICGHSKCGAVGGLIDPAGLADLPAVSSWLIHSAGVPEEVARLDEGLSPTDRLNLAIERNVLHQAENLRTHPAVIEALAAGQLRLHAWVYHFENGEVVAHDPASPRFVSLVSAPRQRWTAMGPPAESRGDTI